MKDVKDFRSIDEQINILITRGLIINDKKIAEKYLSTINYYRLSAYTLTLRKDDKFYNDVKFEDVLEIYFFDMELRNALMQLLAAIEISVRAHVSYVHSKTYGPLGYENSRNFHRDSWHKEFIETYNSCIENYAHNEIFIKHHIDEYGGKYPLWVLVDILTFGTLSKLFSNLRPSTQIEISKTYYNDKPIGFLRNWLHAASILRNLCAHQGRLFNRSINFAVSFLREDMKIFNTYAIPLDVANKTLFGYLLNIKKLVPRGEVWEDFNKKFKDLVIKYPFVLLKHYGFPDNWEDFL